MSGGFAGAWDGQCTAIEEGVSTADPDSLMSKVRVLREPGKLGTPPAVYVPPPTLTWELYDEDPTEAVFEIVLAVKADDQAIVNLFALLPQVQAALNAGRKAGLHDAMIRSSAPGVWTTGGTELPCYFIRTEASV